MKIARDKRLHLSLVFLGALAVPLLALLQRHVGPAWTAFIVGCAVSWAWEFIQKYRGEGTFDPEDATYGCAGAALAGVAVHWIHPFLTRALAQ